MENEKGLFLVVAHLIKLPLHLLRLALRFFGTLPVEGYKAF